MNIDLSNSEATEFEIYLVQGNILIYTDKKLSIDSAIEVGKDIIINFNKEINVNHVVTYNRMSTYDKLFVGINNRVISVDIDFNDLNCNRFDIYNFTKMPVWLFDSNINILKSYNTLDICIAESSILNHMYATLSEYYTSDGFNISDLNVSCLIGDDLKSKRLALLIGNEWCRRIESNSIIDYISPYIL